MPCISKAEYSCLVFCYMSPKGSYFYNHSMHLYVKLRLNFIALMLEHNV